MKRSANQLVTCEETVRHGKWSAEEERFAELLIEEFFRGSLEDCQERSSLRSYLALKLNCERMRISKKFSGRSIGKALFVKTSENLNPHLDQLQDQWNLKLELRQKKYSCQRGLGSPTSVTALSQLNTELNKLSTHRSTPNMMSCYEDTTEGNSCNIDEVVATQALRQCYSTSNLLGPSLSIKDPKHMDIESLSSPPSPTITCWFRGEAHSVDFNSLDNDETLLGFPDICPPTLRPRCPNAIPLLRQPAHYAMEENTIDPVEQDGWIDELIDKMQAQVYMDHGHSETPFGTSHRDQDDREMQTAHCPMVCSCVRPTPIRSPTGLQDDLVRTTHYYSPVDYLPTMQVKEDYFHPI